MSEQKNWMIDVVMMSADEVIEYLKTPIEDDEEEEMSKFPIYALIDGVVTQVAGASTLESAGEIIEELKEKGYECLAVGHYEDDEEDFLSGVTCNPDAPEECESCS